MSTGATDHWADWIRERRFGGDAARAEQVLAQLRQTRDQVLDHAELRPGETLLDVGCGDGLIGLGALERGAAEVIFSDVSQPLLDDSRALAAEAIALDRCRFVTAAAEDLSPIVGESVDVVTTRSVLIYVKDKAAAFAEFFRVLRPRGRISLFEPINRFGCDERGRSSFWGYPMDAFPELATRINAVYDAIQPEDDPMLDFDERDLIVLAENAGFHPIHLDLRADVEATKPQRWETFAHTAGNPRIPTLAEAMAQALTQPERDRVEAHLRPLVEEGRGTWRMAKAYLVARKPPPAPTLRGFDFVRAERMRLGSGLHALRRRQRPTSFGEGAWTMRSRRRLRRPVNLFVSLPLALMLGAIVAGSASSGIAPTTAATRAPQHSTVAPFGAVGALLSARPTRANVLIPTVLHFEGNPPEDTCTGYGSSDVALAGCAELRPTAGLSTTGAAKWVANATFDGTADRNIYDPNWIWNLTATTKLQGPMKIDWWQTCNAACVTLGSDWTIRIWADFDAAPTPPTFETTGVVATPSTPNVPEKLSVTVELPEIIASSKIVLHIDPTFLDTGQGATAYYDSALPCPGATVGPCDSTVTMPVVGPTAVQMGGFNSRVEGNRVVLRWRTAAENGVLGFNVWRRGAGAEQKVNRGLVAAAGRIGGASYRLVDRTTRPGTKYAYRLQVVNRDGSRSWQGNTRVRTTR